MPTAISQTVIEGEALRLAFQAGQLVERLLVRRAIELATGKRPATAPAKVTRLHVAQALDRTCLAQVLEQADALLHDSTQTGSSKAPRGKVA